MKKVLLSLLGLGLLVPAVSFAADIRAGSSQSLSPSEVVNDDLYLFGSTVINSGTVHGDFIATGGTVLVAGPVDGTVQIAGGNLSLTGTVGQTVRAAGGSILINGAVGKDVVVAGGTVEIDGGVGRDVVAGGGTVIINAPIAGHVQITAQKVVIGSKAVINGTLTYQSPAKAQIDPNAKIVGQIKYTLTPAPSKQDVSIALSKFFTLWLLLRLAMTLVFALLLVWLMKRYSSELVESAFANPVVEFAKGLAAIILFPIISIILCVSLIGLPIGMVGMLSYIALFILSSVLAPLLVGSLVYKWVTKSSRYEASWKTVLLGVVLYFIIGIIPIIGPLFKCLFITIAFAVILKATWNIVKTMR